MPRLPGCEILALLDVFRFVRKVTVLDGVAEPARVVAAMKMIHPCRLVDALSDLAEDREILRLEIVLAIGTTEINFATYIMPHN